MMSAAILRWWKRRHSNFRRRHTEEELSQRDGGNLYGDVQLVTLFTNFPPIVLANNGDIDALGGSQKLPRYVKAKVVDGHYNSYVGFRQEQGWGLLDVKGDKVSLTAPNVTMQVQALLIPTGTETPIDAEEWYIGIVQVMLEGTCNGYYGRTTDVAEVCNELYFCANCDKDTKLSHSSDLPLLDRITDTKGEQQPAWDDDPAYSEHASSPAKVRDVYASKQVYCQILMTDQPSQTFDAYSDINGSRYYLNRVDINCSYRTMVCVYKRGFGSNPVHPLQAVDWYFNATAIRHPTLKDKFHFDVTPLSQPPFKISSFAGRDIPPFHSSWSSKKDGMTFESPNTAQKRRNIVLHPPQKIYAQETCV